MMNKVQDALEKIADQKRYLRDGGPSSEDLHELDEGLNTTILAAESALSTLESGELVIVDGERLKEVIIEKCSNELMDNFNRSTNVQQAVDVVLKAVDAVLVYLQRKDGE